MEFQISIDLFFFSFFCSTRLYYSDPNNVISVLDVLEDQTFFYITAGGDEKASGGQDEFMAIEDLIFERYYAPWMPVRNAGGVTLLPLLVFGHHKNHTEYVLRKGTLL